MGRRVICAKLQLLGLSHWCVNLCQPGREQIASICTRDAWNARKALDIKLTWLSQWKAALVAQLPNQNSKSHSQTVKLPEGKSCVFVYTIYSYQLFSSYQAAATTTSRYQGIEYLDLERAAVEGEVWIWSPGFFFVRRGSPCGRVRWARKCGLNHQVLPI